MDRSDTPTPEDLEAMERAARGFREAMNAGDLRGACRYMTQDYVARHVAGLLFSAFHIADGLPDRRSLEELVVRHGLPPNTKGEIPRGSGLPDALDDLVTWIATEAGQEPDARRQAAVRSAGMRFTNYRVYPSGRAYADLETDHRKGRIEFARTDAGWGVENAEF